MTSRLLLISICLSLLCCELYAQETEKRMVLRKDTSNWHVYQEGTQLKVFTTQDGVVKGPLKIESDSTIMLGNTKLHIHDITAINKSIQNVAMGYSSLFLAAGLYIINKEDEKSWRTLHRFFSGLGLTAVSSMTFLATLASLDYPKQIGANRTLVIVQDES